MLGNILSTIGGIMGSIIGEYQKVFNSLGFPGMGLSAWISPTMTIPGLEEVFSWVRRTKGKATSAMSAAQGISEIIGRVERSLNQILSQAGKLWREGTRGVTKLSRSVFRVRRTRRRRRRRILRARYRT